MPERERSIRVEAVVLKHSNWGEADRLLVLFTRERGKARAIAKGVRKMHSRKAGHLEPFTRVTLQMSQGRDLWIITQAETVESYPNIRENLVRTAYASYIMELAERFTYEEGASLPLYQLIHETLKRVDSEVDANLAVRYYEIHLLDLVGFRPQLIHCVSCRTEIIPRDQFFDAGMGGVLCPDCGVKTNTSRPVSMQALKFIRHLQRSSYKDASRAQIPPEIQREIEALLQWYITYQLERGLNSPGFLQKVRRQETGSGENITFK
jgi:DNA repair protein RecO (recombination protein O)